MNTAEAAEAKDPRQEALLEVLDHYGLEPMQVDFIGTHGKPKLLRNLASHARSMARGETRFVTVGQGTQVPVMARGWGLRAGMTLTLIKAMFFAAKHGRVSVRMLTIKGINRIIKDGESWKDYEEGPETGTYMGQPIPAWVKVAGSQYEFIGLPPKVDGGIPLDQIADDELVILPGLLYKRVSCAPKSHGHEVAL